MLRIAYLLTWPWGRSTGVFRKVVSQVATWRTAGADVGLFLATTEGAHSDWIEQVPIEGLRIFKGNLDALRVQRALVKDLVAWRPSIAYVRTTPRHINGFGILDDIPVVIEIQSEDLAEAQLGSRARTLVAERTRGRLLGRADGLVFTSSELSQSPSYRGIPAKSIVIGNGIDLNDFQIQVKAPHSPTPRLAFIGQGNAAWHGIDEILSFASTRPGWRFDVIGPAASQVETTPANVQFHGELTPEHYRPILQQADIGLGTMALYRKGMNEASPLKTREYLALGLPVIGAYQDTDIPEGSPYFLKLPNEPASLLRHAKEVEAFICRWRGRRVPRMEIEHLDWREKERDRMRFLASIAREPR